MLQWGRVSRSACRPITFLSAASVRGRAPQMQSHSISATGSSLLVERVPCLSDNYAWLVHDTASQLTAVVDPAEVAPVEVALKQRGVPQHGLKTAYQVSKIASEAMFSGSDAMMGLCQAKHFQADKDIGWTLNQIWNTHHHLDHVGGNLELKSKFPGLRIIGPRADKDRIPGIDQEVGDGDKFEFGQSQVHVFDTPGHTRGHITFWSPSGEALFPGDTLFALGCGRVFEGTHEQMWSSLSKLLPLPDATRVYCAHEYTQSNARFAVAVDPNNAALKQRKADVDLARDQGIPTVPSLLGEEKATNPFLRPFDPELRAQLGLSADALDWEVFGAVRKAKDNFRG